jgi:hypothetical protein
VNDGLLSNLYKRHIASRTGVLDSDMSRGEKQFLERVLIN